MLESTPCTFGLKVPLPVCVGITRKIEDLSVERTKREREDTQLTTQHMQKTKKKQEKKKLKKKKNVSQTSDHLVHLSA